ncbi:hypothetical protein V1506DRAFT_526350 [Lipomyces tetrasporus]
MTASSQTTTGSLSVTILSFAFMIMRPSTASCNLTSAYAVSIMPVLSLGYLSRELTNSTISTGWSASLSSASS